MRNLSSKQKVLTLSTYNESLRSEVYGWGHEDGNEVLSAYFDRKRAGVVEDINQMHVGMIRSGHCPSYPTPLHALGDGWRLLAPPTSYQETRYKGDQSYEETFWSWWLVKE